MVKDVTFSSLQNSAKANAPVSHDVLELHRLMIDSGLKKEQIAALFGVTHWRQYLFSEDPKVQSLSANAAEIYGYIKGEAKSVSAARRSPNPNGSIDRIIEDIVGDEDLANKLIKGDLAKIVARYNDLSKPQVKLLSRFVQHQFKLDNLVLDDLVSNFPFRIIKPNFFGRFIASGCDDPEQGVRHLQLSLPFFVRMRSLVEGLCNDRQRFLAIEAKDSLLEEEGLDAKKVTDESLTRVRQFIYSCIDHASDFSGGNLPNNIKGLRTIQIPSLPEVPWQRVDKHEKNQLSIEYGDWLLFGARDGKILNRKQLMPTEERRLKRLAGVLKRVEAELSKLDANPPPESSSSAIKRKWGDKVQRLEKKIEDVKEFRLALLDEKSNVKSILFDLERSTANRSEINRFRKEIESAINNNERIVFASLDSKRSGSFFEILDRLYIGKGHPNSLAVKCIQDSAVLMSQACLALLKRFSSGTANSCEDQQVRAFTIDLAELNQSVKYVVNKALPDKTDVRLRQLIDPLIEYCSPPGIKNEKELLYAARSWHGRHRISIEGLIEYAFDHAVQLRESHLKKLLSILRELGVEKIPDRCKEIITGRFHLPGELVEQFEVYSRQYRPSTLGQLPDLFESQTSLSRYLDLNLDGCGMAPEVDQVQEHLINSGIVGIVNGTDYHPELVLEVADTKVKDSTENTSEIWGDYIRLPERLVRSLALRLVEAKSLDELLDSSLVTVRKPDKHSQIQEMLYKKFLGIDLGLSPDFDKVNSVIAELAVHNPKTILVLDAAQVKDFTQYRKLVDTLRRSRLKVILINLREALPGIPHVQLESFIDADLPERIKRDNQTIHRKLGLAQEISEDVLQFTANQVKLLRRPSDDPLNLNLQVITSAAQHARMKGFDTLDKHDIIQALPAIFHRADSDQLYSKIKVVRRFAELAPLSIFGQKDPISQVTNRIESHLLGLRDPIRPLTLLLTGPTGVGKTELMKGFAMAINFPFFLIEGSQFTESHTISRLIGSPSGYKGPEEGILFKFLKDNVVGLVFVDEIEKMHYDVYMGLLNFWDIGVLTAGDAETVSRPSFIIVGASNAGADKLTRGMKATDVRSILSDAFRDRNSEARPELVARFEPILMLAIDSNEFRKVLSTTLQSMGERFGWVNANLELTGVDDVAVDILFDASRELCEYEEKIHRMGFGQQEVKGNHLDLYYNLRHVSRAVDQRAGESLREIVTHQYASKAYTNRGNPRRVVLIGDRKNGLIKVVDSSETNRSILQ